MTLKYVSILKSIVEDGHEASMTIVGSSDDGFYMIGDAQTEIEGPIKREQIFAKITRVERKGKTLTDKDFWWKFFEGPWLSLYTLRPIVIKLYGYKK